jgi:hypothetical protein
MAGITQAERERRDRRYELGLKDCNACTEPLPLDRRPRSAVIAAVPLLDLGPGRR